MLVVINKGVSASNGVINPNTTASDRQATSSRNTDSGVEAVGRSSATAFDKQVLPQYHQTQGPLDVVSRRIGQLV